MANLPTNLPALLRSAGLTVVEVDGWRNRGRPGSFSPVGVLEHHTGASARGWTRAKELAYARWMFLTGRPDLPAPLCQIALGRSGTVYIGAVGRANHAGRAVASGSVAAGDGNALYIGIEWMLSGTEQIPDKMRRAGVTLAAVLTEKVTKTSVNTISCHYQTSVTGKWDIGDPSGVLFRGHRVLDVPEFRSAVAAERKRLYAKGPKKLKVRLINVPHKVGRAKWRKNFRKASRSAVFGLNESLTRAQRNTYAAMRKQSSKPLAQYGLRSSPNPIFWRKRRFARVSGRVIQIHPAATGALARRYPGFNSARYVTEVVLRQRKDGQEFAVLNTHWVPRGRKVNPVWRRKMRRQSKRLVRQLVRQHERAGRVVVVMGDFNLAGKFKMPKIFNWIWTKGVDKIGATRPGKGKRFRAPTDHKYGVQALIRL